MSVIRNGVMAYGWYIVDMSCHLTSRIPGNYIVLRASMRSAAQEDTTPKAQIWALHCSTSLRW